MEVVEVLKNIRRQASLITLVGEHDLCASMCVAIYLQGQTRYASPAITSLFHGASASLGGVPSLTMTLRYFDLFTDRDIDESFIDFLFKNQYVTTPGSYRLSGSELAGQSNIITKLLPNWKPTLQHRRRLPAFWERSERRRSQRKAQGTVSGSGQLSTSLRSPMRSFWRHHRTSDSVTG
jgi:hypothetical protein